MEKSRLEEIKARFEESTYGHWKVYETEEGTCIGTKHHHPQLKSPSPVVSMSTCAKEPHKRIYIRKEDAEFITHAKQDIECLIEQVKHLEKERMESYQEGYRQGRFDELMGDL